MSTKKITTIGVLCAMALVVATFIRFPIVPAVPFMSYEPKDVILVIGGFIYGPMTVLLMSVICSLLEIMLKGGNLIDVLMNVISTCAFAATAAAIYQKKHTKNGALLGLGVGVVVTVFVMILWNYIVTPIYYNMPREAVVALMIPGFIPFNLLKYGLNAGVTLVLYKPVVGALRRYKLVGGQDQANKQKGMLLIGLFVVLSLVGVIMAMQGMI